MARRQISGNLVFVARKFGSLHSTLANKITLMGSLVCCEFDQRPMAAERWNCVDVWGKGKRNACTTSYSTDEVMLPKNDHTKPIIIEIVDLVASKYEGDETKTIFQPQQSHTVSSINRILNTCAHILKDPTSRRSFVLMACFGQCLTVRRLPKFIHLHCVARDDSLRTQCIPCMSYILTICYDNDSAHRYNRLIWICVFTE